MIEIIEVDNDLKSFIKFPEILYKDTSNWIPPLRYDEKNILSKKKNPAFEYCEAAYFLAYKKEELVGRVAAIINHNANNAWGQRVVRFGWMDFVDDVEVSEALIKKVENWGKAKGMEEIKGPLGFSDMDKEGLLIDGFDNIPSITTIYNFPYYQHHYERLGFEKDVDWIQNSISVPSKINEKILAFHKIIEQRYGLKICEYRNNKELMKKGIEMFQAYNMCFSKLYEFSTVSEKQIIAYAKQYIPILRKDLICMIEDSNGKVVAFALLLPSLSKAFAKAKGKLFPFGFIHILRALRKIDFIEMLMIGVVPEYQNKGLNAILFHYLHTVCLKNNVKFVVANPQLEDNKAVRSLFADYPQELYQLRRCFKKNIYVDNV